MPSRRATIPVLLLLLAFLAGSGYLVYSSQEGAERDEGGGDVSLAGAIDPDDTEEGGGWRHHDWGIRAADHPQGPAPMRDDGLIPPGPADDAVWDPQMDAMRHSYRFEGDAGGVALPFDPTNRGARVIDSDGALPVAPNASCEVRVLPVEAGGFNCLVRVICDGRVLYPNPTQTAGYAPCEVENGQPISALDDGHTAADGDPLVRLDIRAGTVTVEDRGDGVDAYRATLQIGRR
jgi:hypothetical protein